MFDALYIGATGMQGQQLQIDTVANNVANLNTAGFRRSAVSFTEIAAALSSSLQTTDAESSAQASPVAALGAGALPTVTMSTVAGALRQTNDPMNLAIDGAGFLEVMRADGSPAYTRAGQLRITSDGLLAGSDGSPLAGRIEIPSDAHDLRISADGHVSATLGGSADPTELGRIDLVGFSNPAGLEPLGDGLYSATELAGQPQTVESGQPAFGSLRQGFLEGSNVQMTDELVSLMLAQRAFELNSKVVQAADQMLAIANGLYR